MNFGFKHWRRQRILKRHGVPGPLWSASLAGFPFLAGLNAEERRRLHEWTVLFLHEKTLHGVSGCELDEAMRLSIAMQACLLILNLDLDYYRGWHEILVYPAAFFPRREYSDASGVVHVNDAAHAGEAWQQGPVILSWSDVVRGQAADGANVVIHEFAHKLDMLNGDANGLPPLHRDMNVPTWAQAFSTAYADLQQRLDSHQPSPLEPYAAESPAEFFAVMSEAFFEIPHTLLQEYPAVYRQLARFYRQDPERRMAAQSAHAAYEHA